MAFTKEQEDAIYTRNKNILVSAGAGSGKTTVLVERIVQAILKEENNINIDDLLIVTFTRAAATEMKTRLYSYINKELAKNPENIHLKNQFPLLDKSYITTIDSFCLNVVRKHFKIVDIDPNFKIADPAEIEILKTDALNDFFEELYENENQDFLNLLNSYSTKVNDSDFIEKFIYIYNQIQNLDYPKRWLNKALEPLEIKTEASFFNSTFFEIAKNSSIKILNTAKNICFEIENVFSKILTDNFEKPKFLVSDLQTCEELTLALEKEKYKYFLERLEEIKFEKLSLKQLKEFEEEKNKIKNLRDNFKEILSKIKNSYFPYPLDDMLNQNQKIYPVLKTFCDYLLSFDDYFLNIKKEKKIFSFNDISHFCLKILLNKDLEPTKIAKEYKQIFKEIIIDEYQDINSIQDLILYSISKENNRFMVGDIKQCIYKFRNSNPKIFIEKYSEYENETYLNKKIDLNQNFRSNKPVVDSINFIFEQIMDRELGEVDYDKSAQLNFSANFNNKDDVNENITEKCNFYIIDKSEGKSEEYQSQTLDDLIDLKNVELEANFVAKKIKDLIEVQKLKIFNNSSKTYEPLRYKDIVVLLRSTKNTADTFTKILAENGIPAFTKTSNGFFEFIEVLTMLNLLKVIDNPIQDLPLVSVLHSPIFNISSEELLEIKLFSKNALFYKDILNYAAANSENDLNLELQNKLKHFIEKLNFWQGLSERLTINELLTFLYEDTSYYSYVGLLNKGDIRQANLLSLLEKAIEFESTNFNGLFNFIKYIDKVKKGSSEGDAKILSEEEDLVRIMSIHKSKGLEFPVVFVCMLSKKFNNLDLRNSILFHSDYGLGTSFVESLPEDSDSAKDFGYTTLLPKFEYDSFQKNIIKSEILSENLSEEMRILYVALTRAKEKLILVGCCNDFQKLQEKWQNVTLSSDKNIDKTLLKLNSSSFLDWIFVSLQRKSETWEIKVIKKEEIIVLNQASKENSIEKFNFIEDIDTSVDHSLKKDVISQKLNWQYPNSIEQNLKSTSSISEIKRNYQKEILRLEYTFEPDLTLNLPKFYKAKSSKVSSAQKGTIYHTVLEHIDFNISTEEEVKRLLKNLVKNNILKEDEAKIIETKKILSFLSSDLVKRLRLSSFVKREKSFVIGLSAFEVYSNKLYKDSSSPILVNGIIDLYFEEDGEIVLVDYKTDRISSKKTLLEKYEMQLNIYKKALQKSTGKKVKEVLIYLINSNKCINL